MEAADGLFPPPDPKNLRTTRKPAAGSQSSPADSPPRTGWRGPSLPGCRARGYPCSLTPHKPTIRTARKDKRLRKNASTGSAPDPLRNHSTWYVSLGLSLLPGKRGLRRWCSVAPDIADRVAAETRSFEAGRMCSKAGPSPGRVGQSPCNPEDLSSLLPQPKPHHDLAAHWA